MLLLSLLALGCATDGRDRFTGGGVHVDPDVDGGDDTQAPGDDTGETTEFEVESVEAGFEDLPNVGTAIFTFVTVANPPGNLDETRIHVTLDGESLEVEGESGIPLDNAYAWVVPDSQEIFTAIEVDGPGSYEMTLYLETGAGERSTTWSGTVDADNTRDLPPKP